MIIKEKIKLKPLLKTQTIAKKRHHLHQVTMKLTTFIKYSVMRISNR